MTKSKLQTKVYNTDSQKASNMELPDSVFGVEWNPDLVHQAFVTFRANQRQRTANTKDRSQVRGGGRKPWQQKYTGRARHGSIRSPIWVGGGVTFGPSSEKKFKKKINKKMKRKALFSLLSKKMDEGEIKVVESLQMDNLKTKEAKRVLNTILSESELEESVLFVPSQENKDFIKAIRNIPGVSAISPYSLNIYDCLANKFIIFEKKSVETIANHFEI